MSILTVIPARMAAERLPGKPLLPIAGVPMIIHVMKRAQEADIGPVIVACDGKEIQDIVTSYGGHAVITDPALPSGTDRVFHGACAYDPAGTYQHVINIQGDQPNVDPRGLKTMATWMLKRPYDMMTIAAPCRSVAEHTNPNVVKIAMAPAEVGACTRAHYFSRSCIPCNDLAGEGAPPVVRYHHIGVYGYTRSALERFVSLPPSYLEQVERLEQLRALEAGMSIDVVVVDSIPHSVDTQSDRETAEILMRDAATKGA